MRPAALLVVLLISTAGCPDTGNAETLAGHARAMAAKGAIWHDKARPRRALVRRVVCVRGFCVGRRGTMEVVARVGRGIGARARARAAWLRSPAHRPFYR